MTEPENQPDDQDITVEKAARDLAFVRDAIERQQGFIAESLPPWFAAMAGAWLFVALAMRDIVSPEVAQYAVMGGAALLAVIASRSFGKGRKRGKECRAGGRGWRMLVPWIGMFAGFALLAIAKGPLELSGDPMRIIFLMVFATSAISVGSMGLLIMRGMGAGAAIAALGFLFAPDWAYPIAGASLGLGLYLGALADHRQHAS